MTGLGDLHICHRRVGKTRHVVTWSVVSICLPLTSPRETLGSGEADVFETGGGRDPSVVQTTVNGGVIIPAIQIEDYRKGKGEGREDRAVAGWE